MDFKKTIIGTKIEQKVNYRSKTSSCKIDNNIDQ